MNHIYDIIYKVDDMVIGRVRVRAEDKKSAKKKALYNKRSIEKHYQGRKIKTIARCLV